MKKLLALLFIMVAFVLVGAPSANGIFVEKVYAAEDEAKASSEEGEEEEDEGEGGETEGLNLKKGEAGVIFIKHPHYCDRTIIFKKGTAPWVNGKMCARENYILKVEPKTGDTTFLGSVMYGFGKRQALFYALPAGHHEFFVYSPYYNKAQIKGRMMKGDFEAGKLYYILIETIDKNDVDETATLDDMGLRFHFFTKDSEYRDDLLKWTSKRVYWQEPKKKNLKAYNKNLEDIKAHYEAVKDNKSRMIEMPKGYGLPLSQYLYKKAPIINRLEK